MRDPFDTLGIPPRFDLDPKMLEGRHRELSKALHPDKFAGAAPSERRLSLQRAVDVNEAYRLLRDPIRRAEILFRRNGVPVGETAEPKPPPAFLMDVMDLREELSEVRRAQDLPRLEKLHRAMLDQHQRTLLALANGLEKANGDTEKTQALLPTLGALRYERRFLDEVAAIEEDLAP